MSKSDYLEDKLNDHVHGKATYTAPANIFIALLTSAPLDSDTGTLLAAKEATYTGYARKSTAAADYGSSSAGTIANTAVINFAACTGLSSTVKYFAKIDASSAGNALYSGPLGNNPAKTISAITRASTTATATSTAHGYTTGDEVDVSGATQPEYNGNFVITVVDANTFTYTVSGTPATPATTTGSIQARKITPLAISNGITPSFAIGALTHSED
jgi:hypothetical protein